ncbi:WSC domain-containing protein [Crucibulum laeve]|uniref:WSC domain-containing protein n=1 Tax=Crucibulum laeve TaxID=68775 RepID=A0A5C3LHP3_9AGAR|nr:WSC domain-containing protein [Crucibulum laeve]
MTVESCIAFCDGAGYIFSGTEFAHCDSTIQVPSQPAALSDCNVACDGNSAETCGASNRMNIFTNGKPGPVIPQTLASGTWSYQGCFTDIVSGRTLGVPVNIPGGVTVESCTAACQSLGAFANAGVENGRECWCDNTVRAAAQRVSDNDCRQICDSNHNEYCGNANRIAVYHFSASGQPQAPPQCLNNDIGNFTMKAVYKDGVTPSVKLKVVVAEMVRGATWTVLSVRLGLSFY